MAWKCYDYKCDECRYEFDDFFDDNEQTGEYRTCLKCGGFAPRTFLYASQVDAVAARFWNNIVDPKLGVFTDKRKYHRALEGSGSTPYEPGMEREAEENNRRILQKSEDDLRQIVAERVIGPRSIDEVRTMIGNDAKLQDAQRSGDVDTIRKMGSAPSTEEAYERDAPNLR